MEDLPWEPPPRRPRLEPSPRPNPTVVPGYAPPLNPGSAVASGTAYATTRSTAATSASASWRWAFASRALGSLALVFTPITMGDGEGPPDRFRPRPDPDTDTDVTTDFSPEPTEGPSDGTPDDTCPRPPPPRTCENSEYAAFTRCDQLFVDAISMDAFWDNNARSRAEGHLIVQARDIMLLGTPWLDAGSIRSSEVCNFGTHENWQAGPTWDAEFAGSLTECRCCEDRFGVPHLRNVVFVRMGYWNRE